MADLSQPARGRDAVDDVRSINTRQEFAQALSRLREGTGYTVRDLAKAVDLPHATLGGYLSGRHLPGAKPPDQLRRILVCCGVTESELIGAWYEALARVRRAPGPRPAGAPVPYRGLESFQVEDADWFFGREELTGHLLEELACRATSGGILMVVGPSGVGKSSLIRAGAVASLRRGRAPASDLPDLYPVVFNPGVRPVDTLAERIAELVKVDAGSLAAAIRDDPSAVTGWLTAGQLPAGTSRVALVVDQFEEVFTACTDEDERRTFITALCVAATGDLGPAAVVVLGLRADFYDHAVRVPQLAEALQQRHVVVGPMTEAQLRRAIVEPARRANLDVEDGLVEVLLRDFHPDSATGTPSTTSLPLLSHALLATWRSSRGGRLTLADYQSTGGVRSAVSRSAEAVYTGLDHSQRLLTRDAFLRLVHVNAVTAPTRRRVPAEEFTDAAAAVLERFIDARLVTAHAGQVEITHEAVVSAWPRLREWIDADHAGLRLHRQITDAAQAWRDNDRDPLTLLRGSRLAAARDWLATSPDRSRLNELEHEFVTRSVDHERDEIRAAQRRGRRLAQLAIALTVLLLATTVLAVVALRQRATANRERDLAVARQIATSANQLRATDPGLAMQLALVAYRTAPVLESRSSLLSSYASPTVTRVIGPPGVMQSLALTPDARTLATTGSDHAIRLWDLREPGRPRLRGEPLRGHTETVFAAVFDPTGTLLATGGGDRTVRIWNLTAAGPPAALATLTGPANTVYSLAFSPDGRSLAAGSADNHVHRWTMTYPRTPVEIGPPLPAAGFVHSVAYSPDGEVLAAGSADRTVRLWNVTTTPASAIGPPLTGPARTVFSVAFSPDGRTLAAGSADRSVWTWAITDPTRPVPGPPLTGPTGWINSITFDSEGGRLAAGSSDGKVWIWDPSTARVTATLPHPAPVTTVKFTADSTLASSGADGIARLWQLPGPVLTGPTEGVFNTAFATHKPVLAIASSDNTASVWNVADPTRPVRTGPPIMNASLTSRSSGAATLSPDARTLAVGAIDGSIQLWDVSDPAHPSAIPAPPTVHTAAIQALCFSPDGRVLAAASNDRTASLWDASDPHRTRQLGTALTGPSNYAYSPIFSPDGRIFGLGSADNKIRLWDVSDPTRPVPLGPPLDGPANYVFSLAFTPDSRTLAAGSADNTVRLWDLTDPHRPQALGVPLTGPDNYVYAVAFSPDGRTLAAAGGDGTIWLWNVTNRRRPTAYATITGHARSAFIVEFADRHLLATGGADKVARLWSTDPETVAQRICATAGHPITLAEWRKYVPGRPYHQTC